MNKKIQKILKRLKKEVKRRPRVLGGAVGLLILAIILSSAPKIKDLQPTIYICNTPAGVLEASDENVQVKLSNSQYTFDDGQKVVVASISECVSVKAK